jgi:hypothetical protein
MRFDRESWRKLYIVESAEHRLLPMFTRGMRDYLLRLASDDGTILRNSSTPKADLQRLLNVEKQEKPLVDRGFDQLVAIGYLSVNRGRVWITRFAEAQEARSPGAKRQATYKANLEAKKRLSESSPPPSPASVTTNVTGDAQGDAPVTSQIDETRRDETRREPPAPAVVVADLADRARKVLENPHDGQFAQPSKWPEVVAVCEAWAFGMPLKLRDHVSSDSDLRAILEAFRDGYTVEQLIEAGKLSLKSDYFKTLARPGPASFTAAVLRRLLAPERLPASSAAPRIAAPTGTAPSTPPPPVEVPRLVPMRAPAGPKKTREEALEALRLVSDPEDAPAGEQEAATHG